LKIYQVGGAVRDRLLGLPVHDIDYVVVGSSVEEMLAKGFRPVGSHFPVFLHPQTQHEYALARTERKTAPGHQGFVFHADPSIRLEDDLKRRDLTINAIAQEVNASGESKERVWQELAKAFISQAPECFIEVLEQCDALEEIWPNALVKQWQHMSSRKEILAQLHQAVTVYPELDKRLAIVLKRLKRSEIVDWASGLRVPNDITEYCLLTADFEACRHSPIHPQIALDLFNRSDVWRKPKRFIEVLRLADTLGIDIQEWQNLMEAALQIDGGQIAAEISQQGISTNHGTQIHQALAHARLMAITRTLDQ